MEEMEPLMVRIEVNGKKELRVVERVQIDRWNLPQLIPMLYPGETLVESPKGYKVLRTGEKQAGTPLEYKGRETPTFLS